MADFRLFPATSGPDTADIDTGAVNLAVEFYVTSAASLTSIWFWNPQFGNANTTPRVGSLGQVNSASYGTVVSGPHTVMANARNSWNEFVLDEPFVLTPNQRYRAVVLHPAGRYGSTASYWLSGAGSSGITEGALVGPSNADAVGNDQGAYAYDSAPAFPVDSFKGGNYWTDITVTVVDPGEVEGTASLPIGGVGVEALGALIRLASAAGL